ncbi:hypothetical protein H4W81_007007 [Nonomuraea africana]|uniref:Bile acid:sodium symporter family protein n=1 Tax=Nonomuraea africana TaxID=46171 RepID=A0ABR9KQC0_9ACTN|nr:hypothetical protein [Nonomuraea africana]
MFAGATVVNVVVAPALAALLFSGFTAGWADAHA